MNAQGEIFDRRWTISPPTSFIRNHSKCSVYTELWTGWTSKFWYGSGGFNSCQKFFRRRVEIAYRCPSLLSISTHGCKRKFIPPPCMVRGGGGAVDGSFPRCFLYVAVFRNDFAFGGKPLIFLTRWGIFYGWWHCWRSVTSLTMVAILAAILDFTKN